MYPFQSLVAATGNDQLSEAYKFCEDALRANPQNPEMHVQKVGLLHYTAQALQGAPDKALSWAALRAAYEHVQQVEDKISDPPDQYRALLARACFDGARVESRDGQPELALAALIRAIDWGWKDMDAIRSDPELESLRALPGFADQLSEWSETARRAALDEAQQMLAEGTSFPFNFTVTDLQGTEIRLADLKGKVVIVDFWGTWCPPCRAEVPSFIKLQEQYGSQGLQIIGLNYEQGADTAENAQLVSDFVEANGINYPCALGTDEIRAQVPDFRGYPTTVFVDPAGRVRLTLVGQHDYELLEAVAVILLEDAQAAASSP
jgi:thiol-disulfide isomerase/thioredoxin